MNEYRCHVFYEGILHFKQKDELHVHICVRAYHGLPGKRYGAYLPIQQRQCQALQ